MEDPRRLLTKYGLRAKKSWGQNFLVDRSVHERIVKAARLGPDDVVIEIGAGLGTLTAALAEAAPARVVAIERDPDLLTVLQQEAAGLRRVEVFAGDALTYDLERVAREANRPVVVVGNLPYQITSPLLFRIADAGPAVARAVVMVQRELAERVVAPPGGKDYGRLSVMLQQRAAVQILFDVPAGAFHPRPKVVSSVMRAEPRPMPLAAVDDPALFDRMVRAAFGARRKMIRRALERSFGRQVLEQAFERSGISGEARAETLSVADLARLSNELHAAQTGGLVQAETSSPAS